MSRYYIFTMLFNESELQGITWSAHSDVIQWDLAAKIG